MYFSNGLFFTSHNTPTFLSIPSDSCPYQLEQYLSNNTPALLSIPSDSYLYKLEQYLSNNITKSPCRVCDLYSQPMFIWIRTTRVQQWYSVRLQDASNNVTTSYSNMYTYFLITFFFCCNARAYFPSNNKEAKFQVFFVHLFFRLPLTTEQWRVSFVWTYIYNPCSYELE
jgi:hypothetical protein